MNKIWQRKWVRILLTALGSIVLLFFIALGAATWYVQVHKQELIGKATDALANATGGEVSIQDVNVGFWKTFPRFNVGVTNIKIADSVYHKPLVAVGNIYTSVNLIKLLFGKMSVHRLYVTNGQFELFTDSTGYTNAYLLHGKDTSQVKKKSDTTKSGLNITVDALEVSNVHFVMTDQLRNKKMDIRVDRLLANVKKESGIFKIKLHQETFVRGLGFKLSNGSFIRNKLLVADWVNMQFDPKTSDLTFDQTPVRFNNQVYNIGGGFNFSADSAKSKLNLLVTSNGTTFADAGSLLSQNVEEKLKMVQLIGPIDVVAHLEGSLQASTPHIQVQATAHNNPMVVPGDVQLDSTSFLGVYNNQMDLKKLPDDTNSEILLQNFNASWTGVPIVSKAITIDNLINPVLDMHLTSNAHLVDLDNKFALNTISLLGGSAKLALDYHGDASTPEKVLTNITGQLDVVNGQAKYLPHNFLFQNINGHILFNGNDIIVKDLGLFLNKNRLLVNITGKNLGKSFLNQTSAQVRCDVRAGNLNLNDFMALFGSEGGNSSSKTKRKKASVSKLSANTFDIDNILEKGTLNLALAANTLQYGHFLGKNLKGNFLFQLNKWNIENVSLQQADGRMALNAEVIRYKNINQVKVNANLQNMDIEKFFYAFDNFGMNGISYQNLRGMMTTDAHLSTQIDNNGNLIKKSTVGKIKLSLRNGALINYGPLLDVQKIVFKKRDLAHLQFAPITNTFYVNKGDIYIKKMEIASSALRLFVEGIYSPYGNTDINIQVPISSLLSKKTKREAMTKEGVESSPGASVYLRASSKNGEPVKIGLDVFKVLRKDHLQDRFKEEFGSFEK